jgi:hypothetical protein
LSSLSTTATASERDKEREAVAAEAAEEVQLLRPELLITILQTAKTARFQEVLHGFIKSPLSYPES